LLAVCIRLQATFKVEKAIHQSIKASASEEEAAYHLQAVDVSPAAVFFATAFNCRLTRMTS
jgi:hypothetical protein